MILKGNRDAWPGDYLRYNYDLNESSIVFDLGGHEGIFTQNIFEKYKCNVYCFEPVKILHQKCLNTFKDNNKIKLYQKGLSHKTELVNFYVAGEASSIYFGSVLGDYDVSMINIGDFLIQENIDMVDLIKINIEGSEYELLEYMINNNLVTKFKNLQIQFHENPFPEWELKYKYIKENLIKTHDLTYEFEFKFENWKLK